MNKYEMMFIVKTTIEEAAVNTTVENLKSVITSMKGEITGFYYVVNFDANNEIVAELDRKAKIDENIIRHMIIRLDEE